MIRLFKLYIQHCNHERLGTKDLEGIEFNHPQNSWEKRTEGEVMGMGELAKLIGGGKVTELLYYSFPQILAATNNLSKRNLVGNGGFGYVYKGKLSGLDVAMTRHNISSLQGPEEFRTEIEAIPNLRHKNIISLLGCCTQGGEKILVYEYMPNKSLASITSDETKRELLKWPKRLRIIKVVAVGLSYLHGHSRMCIIHRDIKSSNILLDHKMNAKISDFGLAIMVAPNTTAQVTVLGTYGYAAPDYVATGKISDKADVYSFGVVLLEIISGQLLWFEADDTPRVLLPDYARKHSKDAQKLDPLLDAMRLVDPFLDVKGHERAQITECMKMALLCMHHIPENRPAMSEVVTMLHSIQIM